MVVCQEITSVPAALLLLKPQSGFLFLDMNRIDAVCKDGFTVCERRRVVHLRLSCSSSVFVSLYLYFCI